MADDRINIRHIIGPTLKFADGKLDVADPYDLSDAPTASEVENDSSVTGATVKDALETLAAATGGEVVASTVGNDSSVSGATVKDALETLASAVPDASDVPNDSSVSGATVKDALETLATAVGDITSDDVSNESAVPGATVTEALDALLSPYSPSLYEGDSLGRPSPADGWDLDAAHMTSPDLAANGWTVTLTDSPWTTLTRAGDVSLLTAPSAGTYQSTLIRGVLCVRGPTNTAFSIYKATTTGQKTYTVQAWMARPNDRVVVFASNDTSFDIGGGDRTHKTFMCGRENGAFPGASHSGMASGNEPHGWPSGGAGQIYAPEPTIMAIDLEGKYSPPRYHRARAVYGNGMYILTPGTVGEFHSALEITAVAYAGVHLKSAHADGVIFITSIRRRTLFTNPL